MMKVFVGCSSRENIDLTYMENTNALAEYLSSEQYDLVCGGTDGLMGVLVNTFKKNQREINLIGVKGYFSVELNAGNITIYDTISERKSALIKMVDLIIFLPGGLGTLDELFTAIESKRAKEHNLPIIIININRYYDNLVKQLDTMYQERFASSLDSKYYFVANDLKEAIQYIEEVGK